MKLSHALMYSDLINSNEYTHHARSWREGIHIRFSHTMENWVLVEMIDMVE